MEVGASARTEMVREARMTINSSLSVFFCVLLFATGDLSAQGHLFCIAASDFKRDIVQTLTASDCVILLHDESSSLPDGSCDVGGSPTGSGTALREE